jgi:hypothetical protein
MKFKQPRSSAWALLLGSSLVLSSCERTEVSDSGRLVLFSPVSGQLLHEGKPVSGAIVQQTVVWGTSGKSKTTMTDGDGRFSFPVMTESFFPQHTPPSEVKVEQYMAALAGRAEIVLWEHVKRSYDLNGELLFFDADGRSGHSRDRNKPLSVTCNITDKRHRSGPIDGRCDLDGAPTAKSKGA